MPIFSYKSPRLRYKDIIWYNSSIDKDIDKEKIKKIKNIKRTKIKMKKGDIINGKNKMWLLLIFR